MQSKRVKVWDLPTRIFHWLLVAGVSGALITGQVGGNAIDWHARIGLTLVGLIVFRLVWGVVGSTHSRFASFLPTPAALRAYLRGQWRGVGHNPLGALSVIALLALLAVQLASGVLANDDIAFNGPLFSLVSKDLSDWITGLHRSNSTLLIALIALHLAAIAFYTHVRKDKLVKPMITGWKEVPPEQGDDGGKARGGRVALIAAMLIALGAVYGASGAWISAAPATPAQVPAAAW